MVLIPFPLPVYYRWYKIESSGGCQCFLWPEGVRYYVWQFSPIHWPEGHWGWPQNTTRYVLIALIFRLLSIHVLFFFSFVLLILDKCYTFHSVVLIIQQAKRNLLWIRCCICIEKFIGTLCALFLKFSIFAGHLQW